MVHYTMVNAVTRCSGLAKGAVQDKNPVCHILGSNWGFMTSHYTFAICVENAFTKLLKYDSHIQ